MALQRDVNDWKRACAVIIPCFNEAANIVTVIRGAKKFLPHVIVINDGSTDDTAAQADSAGAQVINLPRNQGKGAALQVGFARARELGFTWALTMDGDGQHAASDIPSFVHAAQNKHAALVVGDRLHAPQGMPFVRRWVNRLMTAWLSRLAGASFADSQCGFRLVSLEAWAKLSLRAEHFETESEMLVQMVEAGHRIKSVPVQVIYNSNASKIHPLRDTWRWLRWLRTQSRRESSQAEFRSLTSVPAK